MTARPNGRNSGTTSFVSRLPHGRLDPDQPPPPGPSKFLTARPHGFRFPEPPTSWLTGLTALPALLARTCAQAVSPWPPATGSQASGWSLVPGLTRDVFLVLLAGGILLILLLLWARFLRKRPHSHSHSGSGQRRSPEIEESNAESTPTQHHRHRRKRRRREHRSRNPTLAETGGLPPARPERQPPPPA
jgi:hypothetical protein